MRQKYFLFVVGVSFVLLFTIFSYTIKHGAFRKIDFDVTVKLQDSIDRSAKLRTKALVGEVMEGATFFASPEFSVVVVLLLSGFLAYDRKNKRLRWEAAIIPLCFFLLVMAEMYGKSVVHHPAPPFFMIKNPTTIFPRYYINEQFSYPSGHTARAVFIAIVCLYLVVRQWGIATVQKRKVLFFGALGFYVGLVAISRIYLGHHWLSDIIGGVLLGAGCSIIAVGSFFLKRT